MGLICMHVYAAEAAQLVHFGQGDEWRYFKGAQKPPSNWAQNGFNDSSWLNGLSGIGYGKGNNRTYMGDMQGKYLTVYVRKQFTIADIHNVSGMTLSVICDGPFIAYLNGIEVIRGGSGFPKAEPFDISGFVHELLPGKNVVAFECSNNDINSGDFSFVPAFEVIGH